MSYYACKKFTNLCGLFAIYLAVFSESLLANESVDRIYRKYTGQNANSEGHMWALSEFSRTGDWKAVENLVRYHAPGSKRKYIADLYSQYTGQVVHPNGLNYYLPRLNSPEGWPLVKYSIANSSEAWRHLNSIGIYDVTMNAGSIRDWLIQTQSFKGLKNGLSVEAPTTNNGFNNLGIFKVWSEYSLVSVVKVTSAYNGQCGESKNLWAVNGFFYNLDDPELPVIAKVQESIRSSSGQYCFDALEPMQGSTLSLVLSSYIHQKIGLDSVLGIFSHVFKGIGRIHHKYYSAGTSVSHGDLNFANIIVGKSLSVGIIDNDGFNFSHDKFIERDTLSLRMFPVYVFSSFYSGIKSVHAAINRLRGEHIFDGGFSDRALKISNFFFRVPGDFDYFKYISHDNIDRQVQLQFDQDTIYYPTSKEFLDAKVYSFIPNLSPKADFFKAVRLYNAAATAYINELPIHLQAYASGKLSCRTIFSDLSRNNPTPWKNISEEFNATMGRVLEIHSKLDAHDMNAVFKCLDGDFVK